jgi:hypothetical protein
MIIKLKRKHALYCATVVSWRQSLRLNNNPHREDLYVHKLNNQVKIVINQFY